MITRSAVVNATKRAPAEPLRTFTADTLSATFSGAGNRLVPVGAHIDGVTSVVRNFALAAIPSVCPNVSASVGSIVTV